MSWLKEKLNKAPEVIPTEDAQTDSFPVDMHSFRHWTNYLKDNFYNLNNKVLNRCYKECQYNANMSTGRYFYDPKNKVDFKCRESCVQNYSGLDYINNFEVRHNN